MIEEVIHGVSRVRAADRKAEQERVAAALEEKEQEREQAHRAKTELLAQLSAEKDAVWTRGWI